MIIGQNVNTQMCVYHQLFRFILKRNQIAFSFLKGVQSGCCWWWWWWYCVRVYEIFRCYFIRNEIGNFKFFASHYNICELSESIDETDMPICVACTHQPHIVLCFCLA